MREKTLRSDITRFLKSDDIEVGIRHCLDRVSSGKPGNMQLMAQSRMYCMSRHYCPLQEENDKSIMPYCRHSDIYENKT